MKTEQKFLYHYTSLESFLGMTASGTMWATHIRYLNDSSEQRLTWELIRARIETRLMDAKADIRERLLRWKALAQTPQDTDAYVISFSDDGGDRLSQWRGYGGSSGISIGFAQGVLQRECERFATRASGLQKKTGRARLLPVKYVGSTGDEQTNEVIDMFLDSLLGDGSNEQHTSELMAFFSGSVKHEAFKDEQEYRVIIWGLDPSRAINYRARRSLLIPYIDFDIKNAEPSKIIVGPSPNKENTVTALKHMLAARESKDTEVVSTQMPYRDW